ncbi:hypothetical protein P879_01343 [Paragonimus westermani]|uniref:Guanylate cyclase n=1 Tax=Paragonimus westermani TaxID=34504 RepID=A0A8T0CYQ8_9TREM|nr:hypothetical protein P879_01343 [Paragonimus westermani]
MVSTTFLLLLRTTLGTLFLACLFFYNVASDRVCRPSESPKLPKLPFPLPLIHSTFSKILKATQKVNQRRSDLAKSQPKGKMYNYTQEILLGVQLEVFGQGNFAQVLPAIDIALESVRNSSSYSGVTFTTVPILHIASVACDSLAVLEKMQTNEINVLLGPLNDFSIANAVRFSSSMYQVPVVTPAGFPTQLQDKIEYSTLTRVFFTYSDLTWLMDTTMREYGWAMNASTPVGVYSARNQQQVGEGIGHTGMVGVFQKQSITKYFVDAGFRMFQIETDDYTSVVDQYLKRLPDNVRVSILCVDPASVRYIMLKAQELGLINGEYVFINIDLFSTSERLLRPWYQEDASPEENERARNAYRALMTIALRRVNSDAYMEFSNNVRDRSVRDYQTEYGESEVRTVVALFHDAVKLYTDALQDAYTQGIPISQGKTITQLMWNRTVEGVIGKMRIDSNGDRNADYSLLDLDLKSNTFQPVATYLGADRSMHPIPGRQIDWVNERNEPPPGVPVCGFDGSGCQHRHFLIIGAVGAVLFCLFVIVATTLGVYFYRRAELQAISWIIDWSDLEFPDKKTVTKQSLLDDVDASDAPFTSPGAGDAPLANVEGQIVSVGDVPTSPISVGGGNEQMFCVNNELASHKPPRRSIFHKASTSSSGDIAGSGNVAVVPPSHSVVDKRKTINTSVSLQSSDEPATQEVVEEASIPYSTVRRFQQRWVRRHRLSEDNSSTSPNLSEHATANAAMLNHRTGTKPQTEPLYYMKSPSFDYSSITAKPRTMGARKKTDAGETDVTPILEAHSGRRKKDSQVSRHSAELPAHGQTTKLHGTMAMYKGSKVFLRPVRRQNRIESNKETAVEINKIKDLNNDHICRLIGVCLETSRQCFVLEYCPKGSLFDFLKKEQFTMDWMFKLSVMQDICRGMTYLHQIPVPHGHLKSSNCLFDSRFAVKVTDFGLPRIRGPNCQKYDYGTPAYYRNLFWTAPELIPVKESDSPAATFKADVYAYAIICQEIIYRKGPFYVEEETQPEPIEIITAVQDRQTPCYRPALQIQEEGSEEVIQMIRKAWDDDPNKRPDFRMIGKTVGSDSSENLIDNLLERMQGITTNLEAMVDKRTSQYMDEKKRAEDLLYSMLPKSVASQLINKKTVEAESFEMVTIYFSDIVGFTALSAGSTPMEVVNLLNSLYTMFDNIIDNFRVYKVETIGDAYMVASGLPKRIGNEHAREIARMSIAFLKGIVEFQIPHRPQQRLELRIGIHSGPVCAGVVGQRMPRYCLFGDTVNTSSRMESNGKPLKIHMSEATFKVLRTFRSFIMTKRGAVEMKGKGEQTTYWLHGEGSFVVDPVPEGEVLVGGPYDGVVGPIPVTLNNAPSPLLEQSQFRHPLSGTVGGTKRNDSDLAFRNHYTAANNNSHTNNINESTVNFSQPFPLRTIPEVSPTLSSDANKKSSSQKPENADRPRRRVGMFYPQGSISAT